MSYYSTHCSYCGSTHHLSENHPEPVVSTCSVCGIPDGNHTASCDYIMTNTRTKLFDLDHAEALTIQSLMDRANDKDDMLTTKERSEAQALLMWAYGIDY